MWPETIQGAKDLVDDMTARAAKFGRTLKYGFRAHVIVRETEAEAVAYVVCRSFGLNCSTSSSDYIQLYAGNEATLIASLERIQRTATRMIQSLSETSATLTGESLIA